MSGLDVDLIQHGTTDSATLNDVRRQKSWDTWRNVHYRTVPSLTWRQLRGRPAPLSLCTFSPLPSLSKLSPTTKHSCSDMHNENQNQKLWPHILPKSSFRPDAQFLWSVCGGMQCSAIHGELLPLHRQYRSSDARREQPGATAPLQTDDEDLWGLDTFPCPYTQPFAQIWQAHSACENYRVTSALDGTAQHPCSVPLSPAPPEHPSILDHDGKATETEACGTTVLLQIISKTQCLLIFPPSTIIIQSTMFEKTTWLEAGS